MNFVIHELEQLSLVINIDWISCKVIRGWTDVTEQLGKVSVCLHNHPIFCLQDGKHM